MNYSYQSNNKAYLSLNNYIICKFVKLKCVCEAFINNYKKLIQLLLSL